MSFIESTKNNSKFRLLDPNTGEVHQKIAPLPSVERQLCFVYLNNSLTDIRTLLRLWASPLVLVLLDHSLAQELKETIERHYVPQFIYDASRTSITDYQADPIDNLPLFCYRKLQPLDIAPEIKILLSTSGTTGSPKLVKLSEENLLQNALSIIDYLPINGQDVTPLNLPVYYSYGLSVLTTHLIAGGTIVCSNEDLLQKTFWEHFQQYGYTSLAGVPYLYEMLIRIGFLKKELPSLRYFTQAGGNLNLKSKEKLMNYAEEQNKIFYVMYGQTEASARISYVPPSLLRQKIASIGKPIKKGQFRIDEESGELLYAGPNVFGGYATSAEDLAFYCPPKWLPTGDVAREDEEGFFYITGRLKRFVKLFGNRINLDELEELLRNHFDTVSFACTGLDDKQVLIATENECMSQQQIADFLHDKIRLHPTAIRYCQVNRFPLTANGKINYTQLLEDVS